MDVKHEAPDRHRRIAAIMDHLVPVLVAELADVHPERDQDVERMARRHRTLCQRAPQIHCLGLAVALAEQFRFEQIEISELVGCGQRRVVGDVVGGSDEIVERKDQRPVARMDDPRRHRKVLVAVCLAGSQFARGRHQQLATTFVRTGRPERRHPSRTRRDRYSPYRGIRCQNQCCLRVRSIRTKPVSGTAGRLMAAVNYCPWVFNTWLQASEILARFSFRHARTVKSP